MTEIVEPKPEFQALDEAAIFKALDDPDPRNPIACEVARLIEAYTRNFSSHVEQLGRMPSQILRTKPRWPIEAVAMRLTAEAIRDTVAAHGSHPDSRH
jgi:hypothetical protein